MMPRQTEPNANNALGSLLRGMMPGCTVLAENTQTFADYPGRHSDVLITGRGRAPVVVEAEYEPAATVEQDARERLGLNIAGDGRAIEAAIAVRYPAAVEAAYDVTAAVEQAALSYRVLYQQGNPFPRAGWLTGAVTDLADLIRLVSVPQQEVERAAETLENGIERAAEWLDDMAKSRPGSAADLAALLGMSNVPQTRRMACAILANALVFHERIAGMHPAVKHLRQLGGPADPTLQDALLAAWEGILAINYYPIFAIAKDLLTQLPSDAAARVLDGLRPTAQAVAAAGVDNAHDLTGRVFQRLIADRKYLATFYTRPESAALLARLAVAKLEGINWADAAAIGRLRVGDFACGTGALLSAVYSQIAARHEREGGDPARLHPVMLEEVLYGCDVMPSAIHITGSTLSGMQPEVQFGQSRLYTMPYGRQEDGSVKLGSLELLQSSAVQTLFNTSDPALRTGSVGEETAAQVIAQIPDGGFDLVIMNPPFTRATNHEGAHATVVNPAFAAFDASKADMDAMGKRLNLFGRNTCYHGNAGIASAFVALADKKLKPGGVLALVLPLSAAAGGSWQGFRQMLARGYDGLTVFSIAANGKEMSFSSDTGMGECLVIARKLREKEVVTGSPCFLSLHRRPRGFDQAAEFAKGLRSVDSVRSVEDGPYGGTPLTVGDELVGEMVTILRQSAGLVWGGVRISDHSLAQVAYRLVHSELWLPREVKKFKIPILPKGKIGILGLVSRDINGPMPRGAFDKVAYSPTATYPALWNHEAPKETKIVCEPDSSLQVRIGMEKKSEAAWQVASRSHLNTEFTFGSQALAVAFTDSESMGGRVWPNVKFPDTTYDYAFSLWGNTTLGLVSYWWHSSRQQSSKATVSVRTAESLHTLDLNSLSAAELDTAQEIFEEFRDKELRPAYLAYADPNRALLDRLVICDLLGLEESAYAGVRRLAAKWCAEPSVHGGKARPKGARLVV